MPYFASFITVPAFAAAAHALYDPVRGQHGAVGVTHILGGFIRSWQHLQQRVEPCQAKAAAGCRHARGRANAVCGRARVKFPTAGSRLVSSTNLAFANRVGALCKKSAPDDTMTVGYVSQLNTVTLEVGQRTR